MFVVDSSVWIDFYRDKATREVALLERGIAAINQVFMCGPVLQEVLQGIRNDLEFERERVRLSGLPFLETTRWTFLRAASVYRNVRKRGHTLGRFDAAITALCLEHRLPLLTSDRKGFEPLARHAGLTLA